MSVIKNRLTHQVSTYDLSKLNIYLFICCFKKIRNFRNPKIRNQSHRHHADEKLFWKLNENLKKPRSQGKTQQQEP